MLRSLADVFRDFFRSGDVICRYGGEEFAFVLPESSAEEAARRDERLRHEVKELKLEYGGKVLGQVTLSIRLAAYPEHGTTAEDLLKEADQGLYHAKSAGRDQVIVADAKHGAFVR